MTHAITLVSTTLLAFYAHHYAEKRLTRNWTRDFKLVVKGYQIHHSFFGAVAVLIGLIFTSSFVLTILLGYGLGNIWQHKKTHNRVNEKGLVFITKHR